MLPEAKVRLRGLCMTVLPERAGCKGWEAMTLPRALCGRCMEEARVQNSLRK